MKSFKRSLTIYWAIGAICISTCALGQDSPAKPCAGSATLRFLALNNNIQTMVAWFKRDAKPDNLEDVTLISGTVFGVAVAMNTIKDGVEFTENGKKLFTEMSASASALANYGGVLNLENKFALMKSEVDLVGSRSQSLADELTKNCSK